MTIKLLYFGRVREITGSSETALSGVKDILELKQNLFTLFPSLKGSKFQVSVNRKIANDNTPLANGDEVAILPPFAGG